MYVNIAPILIHFFFIRRAALIYWRKYKFILYHDVINQSASVVS